MSKPHPTPMEYKASTLFFDVNLKFTLSWTAEQIHLTDQIYLGISFYFSSLSSISMYFSGSSSNFCLQPLSQK